MAPVTPVITPSAVRTGAVQTIPEHATAGLPLGFQPQSTPQELFGLPQLVRRGACTPRRFERIQRQRKGIRTLGPRPETATSLLITITTASPLLIVITTSLSAHPLLIMITTSLRLTVRIQSGSNPLGRRFYIDLLRRCKSG
jgi:hypothetical protein